MTPRFEAFMPFILKEECNWPERADGEPSNDPNDPGGYTRFGIDQSSHSEPGRVIDVKGLTYSSALQVYYDYPAQGWLQAGIESMPPKWGEAYFNCTVNAGPGAARRIAAQASPGTFSDFLDFQESYYIALTKKNAHLAGFLPDWLGRTRRLKNYLQLAS